jgi:hypothetical protein
MLDGRYRITNPARLVSNDGEPVGYTFTVQERFPWGALARLSLRFAVYIAVLWYVVERVLR